MIKKINTDNFEKIFQYGFHDTEISSIEDDKSQIILNFNKGIYLLDDTGKESILSKPMQMVLQINSEYPSAEAAIDITEYGKKTKFVDYFVFKKNLQKKPFGIAMVYYSNFNDAILFAGGFGKEAIEIEISSIENVIIRERN